MRLPLNLSCAPRPPTLSFPPAVNAASPLLPCASPGKAGWAAFGQSVPPAGLLRIMPLFWRRTIRFMSRPSQATQGRSAEGVDPGRAMLAAAAAGSEVASAVGQTPITAARGERDQRLAAWLAAAAGGDHRAFESFYDATFAYARTVARRLLRDPAEVEDLLADAYFEAWRSLARFDSTRGSAVTWLLTVVRSRALDALRAAAARPDRAALAATADAMPGDDIHAAPESDPAEQLWRRQSGTALHAALAALSAPERWVLGLAYLRELSHSEIARCTGMPLGTVKSHAQRAQNKLRALLSPGRPGPERLADETPAS